MAESSKPEPSKPAASKGNGGTNKALEPRVAQRDSFEPFEQTNMRWRHKAKVGTTTEELLQPGYLQAVAGKLQDGDEVDVWLEDWSRHWKCSVVQGGRGRDGSGGVGTGHARMIVQPGYPEEIPAIDRSGNEEIPKGYSVFYNAFTRRHVPMWGAVPLNADGTMGYEEARSLIVHHSRQAASVQKGYQGT